MHNVCTLSLVWSSTICILGYTESLLYKCAFKLYVCVGACVRACMRVHACVLHVHVLCVCRMLSMSFVHIPNVYYNGVRACVTEMAKDQWYIEPLSTDPSYHCEASDSSNP